MKFERAIVNTIIEDSAIVIGFWADIFVFHHEITVAKICGTLIILVCCFLIGILKR